MEMKKNVLSSLNSKIIFQYQISSFPGYFTFDVLLFYSSSFYHHVFSNIFYYFNIIIHNTITTFADLTTCKASLTRDPVTFNVAIFSCHQKRLSEKWLPLFIEEFLVHGWYPIFNNKLLKQEILSLYVLGNMLNRNNGAKVFIITQNYYNGVHICGSILDIISNASWNLLELTDNINSLEVVEQLFLCN